MRRVVTVDYAPGPQSGGRAPAPGRLALVQAFLNSFFDLDPDPAAWGRDLFATPGGLARWLAGRGLLDARSTVTEAEHARALAVRARLRELLAAHNDAAAGGEGADGVGGRGGVDAPSAGSHGRADGLGGAGREATEGLVAGVRLDADGRAVSVPATRDVAGALGLILALVNEAQIAGGWGRLKTCPGHGCGWAFYDHSRNQGSTWCSVKVCGSREKARAYRRRSRG